VFVVAKITKAQARKRCNEAIIKMDKVYSFMRLHDATKADLTRMNGLFLDLIWAQKWLSK
jgi:hypothetical protein